MDRRAIVAAALAGVVAVVTVTALPLPIPVALAVVFVPGVVTGVFSRNTGREWLDGAAAGFVTGPLVGLAYFLVYGRVVLATSIGSANPPTPLTGGVPALFGLFLYGFLFFPAFTLPSMAASHALGVYRRRE
ncbi:hypothetical protein [Halocalculus aciditolerans]|uniref:Uncharacterized protein n=1 Tax=Halocalculus aciditolerans TaxID=1383812 RepID=A0A830FCT7_9EURY|nr:hypothetical protein [Halocalculus aciditolerans]GGL61938.1 hypothetical protein GCM10009039_20200 [Halocalculus aciditolerans]